LSFYREFIAQLLHQNQMMVTQSNLKPQIYDIVSSEFGNVHPI
jgi:hypothetical protein